MESDRRERLSRLFDEASRLDGAARSEWLARECGDDEALRCEVESLLEFDDDDTFLETPVEMTHAMPDGDDATLSPPLPLTVLCDEQDHGARYAIASPLGEGGMGQVFLARDRLLDREVAVKISRQKAPRSEGRFYREALTSGRLDHPHIPPVHDYGVDDEGRPVYVMRRIQGHSLAEILADRSGYSLARLLMLFQQACLAIDYAHSQGIVHRDIKPANIMVGEYGELYVVDWGLSESHASGGTGDVAGTPRYMSPEQARGESQVDPRSDVFSLGAMLYEIVVGVAPFPADDVLAILERVKEADFERGDPWEGIPLELKRCIAGALEKDAPRRTASARHLHDQIQEFLEGTKERERRQRAARAALEDASKEIERRDACLAEAGTLATEVEAQRPEKWASADEKAPFWELEDRLLARRDEAELATERAIDRLVEGLGHVRDDADLLRALSEIYWERFQAAEARRDTFQMHFFENHLLRLGLPEYEARLRGRVQLSVRTTPPATRATLSPVHEKGRVHRPHSPREIDADPATWESDPLANWELHLECDGHRSIVAPVSATRARTEELDWVFRRDDEIDPRFVQVPAGPFAMGGDPDTFESVPACRPHVEEFFIARFPVTWEEYHEFLQDLLATQPDEVAPRLPRKAQGGDPIWHIDLETSRVRISEDPEVGEKRRHWPIFGVSWSDAMAYCTWLSARDGVTYDLPTDEEWEKAARGVDGRVYPWGNRFDPTFCKMADSTPSKAQPEPVGHYERDVSPYGVRDMAGGVREWCSSWFKEKDEQRLIRGGSWNFSEIGCRCAYRVGSPPETAYHFLGFRLVKRPS